ncbi:MAG: hypothetical protein IJ228_10575 [Succinivibrio sp.]|nr:hypothetical protein [Succinivibrio sp.]
MKDIAKRNRLWRRQQALRVFKARLKFLASMQLSFRVGAAAQEAPAHWFELKKESWTQSYRSTGTPCSCPLCRGYEYERHSVKNETRHLLKEQLS